MQHGSLYKEMKTYRNRAEYFMLGLMRSDNCGKIKTEYEVSVVNGTRLSKACMFGFLSMSLILGNKEALF